jgi:phage I-like protein
MTEKRQTGTAALLLYVCESGGQTPEWIKILPFGRVELRDTSKPFEVQPGDLETVIRKFSAGGVDLVVDYEHQTLTGGKAPAAGWIKELQSREDGLYARVEWTDTAKAHILAGEYRYHSPVLLLDPKTRHPLALLHVALTNIPAISNLPPLLAAKYGGEEGPEILVLRDFSMEERKKMAQDGEAMPDGSFPIKSREDVKNAVQAIGRAKDQEAAQKHIIARAKALGCMDLLPAGWPGSKKREEAKAMKQDIMRLLGLTGEQPEAEVLALADTRFKLAQALPEIAQAAGLKPEATVSEIKGTVLALKQGQGELVELKAKVTALETESATAKAEAAVQEALDARKITPGEKEFALKYALQDLEAFKAWVAAKPEVMPDGQGLKTPKPGATGQEGLDAEQLAMCTEAGIKPEAFKASHQQLVEQGLLKEGR